MKIIMLTEKNRDKLQAAIESAQGKARERLLSVDLIFESAAKIEAYLDIPKKHMKGVVAHVDKHAEVLPNAYKWKAYSTQFTLVYCASGWAVTDIRRCELRQNRSEYYVTLTEAAKAAILSRFEKFNR